MKKHTQIYLKAMGYDAHDWIPCEICHLQAVDIHHINSRGMGGTKQADTIDNLMAVCRKCHTIFGDRTDLKDWLKEIHQKTIDRLTK